VTYAEVPVAALWEVANFLKLAPEIDFAAADYDPAQERPALIDELLQWGAEQKERKLTLASKLEWETYKHVGGLDSLTDMQEKERVACERCGFIFKMYARFSLHTNNNKREAVNGPCTSSAINSGSSLSRRLAGVGGAGTTRTRGGTRSLTSLAS
jgi:hypothetical protein